MALPTNPKTFPTHFLDSLAATLSVGAACLSGDISFFYDDPTDEPQDEVSVNTDGGSSYFKSTDIDGIAARLSKIHQVPLELMKCLVVWFMAGKHCYKETIKGREWEPSREESLAIIKPATETFKP